MRERERERERERDMHGQIERQMDLTYGSMDKQADRLKYILQSDGQTERCKMNKRQTQTDRNTTFLVSFINDVTQI